MLPPFKLNFFVHISMLSDFPTFSVVHWFIRNTYIPLFSVGSIGGIICVIISQSFWLLYFFANKTNFLLWIKMHLVSSIFSSMMEFVVVTSNELQRLIFSWQWDKVKRGTTMYLKSESIDSRSPTWLVFLTLISFHSKSQSIDEDVFPCVTVEIVPSRNLVFKTLIRITNPIIHAFLLHIDRT